MTQKELLYLEDAIKHEKNIVDICNESMNMLEDEELVSFMEKELKKHEKMMKDLLDMLEVKCNGWVSTK